MTIPLEPIKVYVTNAFLYQDEKRTGYEKATIIGVSAYIGFPLTFQLLVEDKYLYSDVPLIEITTHAGETAEKRYDNKDLSNIICPTAEIENFTLPHLRDMADYAMAYMKHKDTWEFGAYITSIDFYTDNELLHLMELANNQLALVPNHKINWRGESTLPNYKKNKKDYRF